MASRWYVDGMATNWNSNNNTSLSHARRKLLPDKPSIKHSTSQTKAGSRQLDMNNPPKVYRSQKSSITTTIHSNSPKVPRASSSSHYNQPDTVSKESLDKTGRSKPPPTYKLPNSASLGTEVQHGVPTPPSSPRVRRREDRASRSKDRVDGKVSVRSRSSSRNRHSSGSEFEQKYDSACKSQHGVTDTETRASRSKDRVEGKVSVRSRSLSRDRHSSHNERSERTAWHRVPDAKSTKTGTERKEKVADRNPKSKSQSLSKDQPSTPPALSESAAIQGIPHLSEQCVSLPLIPVVAYTCSNYFHWPFSFR